MMGYNPRCWLKSLFVYFHSKTSCITTTKMQPKNEIIPDTTDMSTLQPNEPAIKIEKMEFLLLAHSICKAQVICLVNSHNLFDLFEFFFPNEQLQILVDNTKKNA